MFGIGGFELFIILIFGFLIFGPEKLPEIAQTIGRGIARFREAQQEVNDTIGGEKLVDLNDPDEPFKNPVEVLDRMAQRQEEKRAGKGAPAKAVSGGAASGKPAGTAGGQAAKADGEQPARPAQPADDSPEAPAKPEGAGSAAPGGESRAESFTERKARYERERAARRAAEESAGSKPSPAADTPVAAAAASGEKGPTADEPSEGGDA